jgi:hypothetical protein
MPSGKQTVTDDRLGSTSDLYRRLLGFVLNVRNREANQALPGHKTRRSPEAVNSPQSGQWFR